MKYKFLLLALCVYVVCVRDCSLADGGDILAAARSHIGSRQWSFDGCLHGSQYCGKNKCNIFVYDVITEAGDTAPDRHWYSYSPIGANEWGNPSSSYVKDTYCYDHIPNLSDKQGGDIIAFPYPAGLGHVGIVSRGGNYISAQHDYIEEKGIPSGRTTVLWRYTCDNSRLIINH